MNEKPKVRSSRMWITILKPPLTPGQREVFERLKRCKNFNPNPELETTTTKQKG